MTAPPLMVTGGHQGPEIMSSRWATGKPAPGCALQSAHLRVIHVDQQKATGQLWIAYRGEPATNTMIEKATSHV